MKNLILVAIWFFVSTASMSAKVIKVDINGSGQFNSISAALTNAVAGDTIKVLPGSYFEQITINKNVVVMGSGFETTILNSASNPTVNISAGKLQWFAISSTSGDGLAVAGTSAIITNCVIRGCTGNGILAKTNGSITSVVNCVITNNSGYGILTWGGSTINATNCIAMWNGNDDYHGYWNGYGPLNLSYCNGYHYSTSGNSGCIDLDPQFVSTSDLHLSEGSPCWDKGNPSLLDPDGSVSDMGYFGGPDCPIYPVVTNIKIIPQVNGSITIQATGVANY